MTFTARPTVYNGVRMRSRLEATFAGFLDEAGFEWAYEPRAYGSGRTQYLPDFQVTFSGVDPIYFELKGAMVEGLDGKVALLRRMEVIHASEPDARLALIEAEWLAMGHYGFPMLDPLHPPEIAEAMLGHGEVASMQRWRMGRFAVCRCQATFITAVRYVDLGRTALPIEACAQCEAPELVAWLDPISRAR